MDAATFPSSPVEVNRDAGETIRSIRKEKEEMKIFNPPRLWAKRISSPNYKKKRVDRRSERRPTTLSQFHMMLPTISSGALIKHTVRQSKKH